jgi:hypothetical protein
VTTRALTASLALTFALSIPTLAQSPRTPILVELFTSEGCNSCPPADALLLQLNNSQPIPGIEVIGLEEHVTYWDRLGWRDRFSSLDFTDRQQAYAPRLKFDDSYTPQMVVAGASQFLGSDQPRALAAIRSAAPNSTVRLTVAPLKYIGPSIVAEIAIEPTSTIPKGDLYAALVLPSASSDVKAGENAGHKLDHTNIVLSLQRVGKLAPGTATAKFKAPSNQPADKLRVVVFAQDSNQGLIRGAAISPAR